MSCVVGVDVGGTSVRAQAFFLDGRPASELIQGPSHAQEGTAKILAALSSTIGKAIQGAAEEVSAVGMAVPGHIDDSVGVVRWAPNFGEQDGRLFRYWKDIPLRDLLGREIKPPIHMGNDANLAALGEYRFGCGHDSARCLVMLTLGTGIGGGVIMSPQSLEGRAEGALIMVGGNKGGAELGHVVISYQGVECNSGEYGSIEGYCARDAIVNRALHRIERGRESKISELAGGDLSQVTPETISRAAEEGDDLANEIWEEVGTMLGVGIGNYINIFAPDLVAIGGNIVRAGERLMAPAIKSARNIAIQTLFADSKIQVAERIEDAGLLGGAALAGMHRG